MLSPTPHHERIKSMFKNTYLSFYWYTRGKGKASEILSTTGLGIASDLELEKTEPQIVEMILAEKKAEFAKLPKGKHFFVCLNADFLKTKVRNIQDFEIIEMPNFKQDEKLFKTQLGKDARSDDKES